MDDNATEKCAKCRVFGPKRSKVGRPTIFKAFLGLVLVYGRTTDVRMRNDFFTDSERVLGLYFPVTNHVPGDS